LLLLPDYLALRERILHPGRYLERQDGDEFRIAIASMAIISATSVLNVSFKTGYTNGLCLIGRMNHQGHPLRLFETLARALWWEVHHVKVRTLKWRNNRIFQRFRARTGPLRANVSR